MEAKVDTLHGRASAYILNLSCNGAMVQSAELPNVATCIVLRCGPIDVLGTVVWVQHERFGVQFDEPIPEDLVVQMRRDADELARLTANRRSGRPNFAAAPISEAEWRLARDWQASGSWR